MYICVLKILSIMKKVLFTLLMIAATIAASAQTKKVSILGDSYSTYKGIIPSNYSTFYPDANNDVTSVDQTWWSLYIKAKGYELEKNDSGGDHSGGYAGCQLRHQT